MKTRNLLLALLILALWAATACSRPPQRNYLDSLRSYWQGVYPNGGETLYCGRKFRPFDRSVNVEHVYPMSWVTKKLRCGKREQCRHNSPRFNLIESDMHNMYPARKDVNQTRGAMAFGIIEGENHKYRGCDFEVDFRKRRVEPRPEVRGASRGPCSTCRTSTVWTSTASNARCWKSGTGSFHRMPRKNVTTGRLPGSRANPIPISDSHSPKSNGRV